MHILTVIIIKELFEYYCSFISIQQISTPASEKQRDHLRAKAFKTKGSGFIAVNRGVNSIIPF